MKKAVSFWDILAYIILALLIVWIILKISRVINTPSLIEYFPYFGLAYWAGWAINKLMVVSGDTLELKNFAKETVKEINVIKANCIKNHPKKSSF